MSQLKQNKMVVPILLDDEQYAQICAKADHDLCKPEEIIQEAVEVFIVQMNGERVILSLENLCEALGIYNEAGWDSDQLRKFCEQNKFK
jgi:hypothetical protein